MRNLQKQLWFSDINLLLFYIPRLAVCMKMGRLFQNHENKINMGIN
jgi:hypothetical protein